MLYSSDEEYSDVETNKKHVERKRGHQSNNLKIRKSKGETNQDQRFEEDDKKSPQSKRLSKRKSNTNNNEDKSSYGDEDDNESNTEEVESGKENRKRGQSKIRNNKKSGQKRSLEKESESPQGKKSKQSTLVSNEGRKSESSTLKQNKKNADDDNESTDGKYYEVEKIIEVHHRRDGKREFLIRWRGYKASDDTWEPESHLDCHDLIDKFMERVRKAKNASPKELRELSKRKHVVPVPHARVHCGHFLRNSGFRPFYQD